MKKNREKISARNLKRLGVVGIFIYDIEKSPLVNEILAKFYRNIRGRMGLPLREEDRSLCVISIIFEGTTDELGALTGRLGQIKGVEVKTLLSRGDLNGNKNNG